MISWYFLVLLSSVLMGLATIVAKVSLNEEHATQFSAAVTPIVTLLSLLFIPWANFQLSPEQWVVMIVLGAFNAYNFLLSSRVYKHGELSIASPVFSSLPTLLTVLLAFLFLGEVLTVWQYLVILVMVLVTYFLVFSRKERGAILGSPEKRHVLYLMFLYSFLTAVTTIVSKYLLSSINPYAFLIINGVLMSISFTVIITARYGGLKEIAQTMKRYKLPLVTNALLTLGYRVTYYVALTVAPVALAQPLRNTIFIVITVGFSGLLFKEARIAKRLVLGLALLALAYLLTI